MITIFCHEKDKYVTNDLDYSNQRFSYIKTTFLALNYVILCKTEPLTKRLNIKNILTVLSINFGIVKGKVGTSFKDVKAALEGVNNVALGGTSIPELLVQQVGCNAIILSSCGKYSLS